MRENLHIQIMCLYVRIYFNEYVYVTYSFIFRQLHVCVCVGVCGCDYSHYNRSP